MKAWVASKSIAFWWVRLPKAGICSQVTHAFYTETTDQHSKQGSHHTMKVKKQMAYEERPCGNSTQYGCFILVSGKCEIKKKWSHLCQELSSGARRQLRRWALTVSSPGGTINVWTGSSHWYSKDYPRKPTACHHHCLFPPSGYGLSDQSFSQYWLLPPAPIKILCNVNLSPLPLKAPDFYFLIGHGLDCQLSLSDQMAILCSQINTVCLLPPRFI